MEDRAQGCHNRRLIRLHQHEIGHIGPPFPHQGMLRQIRHPVIPAAPQHREEGVAGFIEIDRIIADAGGVQQIAEFRPDRVMASLILGSLARQQAHGEGDLLMAGAARHQAALRCCSRRRMTIGKAMTPISIRPMITDMTMPGTFKRPRPKVTRPMTKAAMTTPRMLPAPPWILTPPSTTMVTTCSSQPKAIEGRVAPSLEVSMMVARPLARPASRKRWNLTRVTRLPENRAPSGLLPIA